MVPAPAPSRRRRDRSAGRRWHRLLEQYTPDGAVGRLLLGAITASVGGATGGLAVVALTSVTLLGLVVGLASGAAAVAALGVTAVALWPVYLSLIGNVESAAAYPARESPPDERDGALADLKRRYAAGELSEAEFDRRVERLLDADGRVDSHRASGSHSRKEAATPERERQ